MRGKFNEDLLLWAIGVLQPATAKNTLDFISVLFPEVRPLPAVGDVEAKFTSWRESGFLTRVHGKSRFYSLTYEGQKNLSVPLRRYRDQVRLFLLKEARTAKFQMSGEQAQELAGDSPAVDGSIEIQEGGRPITSASDPRGPQISGRSYWPPISKQHKFSAGSGSSSPDIFLEYLSFPTVKSIHDSSQYAAEGNDLSLVDLALAIGVSPRLLSSFSHAPQNHYRTFEIGKRGGGYRRIDAPRVLLKTVQYWSLDYLLWRLPSHNSCHSYQKNKSIQSNASEHVNKNHVANIDIENYFGSITTEMVRSLLLSSGFGEELSKNLSKILTYRGVLPQGSPASPVISNAFLAGFDNAIFSAARLQGISYTRYADDMTLSGGDRNEIAGVIDLIRVELEKLGLRLKEGKTRIAGKGGQQKVTGVVVNTRVSPPRKMRRQVRAMFHNAETSPEQADLNKLRGYLSYFSSYKYLKESEELKNYRAIIERVIAIRKLEE